MAFSGDRVYITQRDDPMASPIPRLTSYEDVEVMVVAQPRPQEHYLYRSARP